MAARSTRPRRTTAPRRPPAKKAASTPPRRTSDTSPSNEEICTVNSQLHDEVDQLSKANSDMTNLLASIDVAAVFLSSDLRIVRFTPAIGRLLNVVPADVGRPLQDLAPRFEDGDLQRDCRTVLEQLRPMEQEVRADDGRSYLRRIRPYRTTEDRIEGVVITVFDITNQLAFEHERLVAERDKEEAFRLAAMVEHLPAGALSVTGDALTMNRATELITGYTRSELPTPHAWFTTLYGVQADEVRANHERARQAGFPHQLSSTLTRKDGERRVVEIVAHAFDGHEVWLLHDVTVRLRLEDDMRAIVTAATDAIISIDAQGTIETFNPAAEKVFGYTQSEAVGQNVCLLMPEPDRSRHDGYLARYRETREQRIVGNPREVTARRKDGTLFPIDLVVSEIRNGDKFTAVIRDLTARRELDRRIATAQVEERQKIARDLHDDLGGELTGIGLLVGSLQNQLRQADSPLTERAASVLDRVETAHERLREIARGLQAVEAVPEGLESALRALADRCTTQDVACRLLPGPSVPLPDVAIAHQLFYIAQEAVNNALRHARASEITIALSATPHGARVEVSDNGIGITRGGSTQGLGLSTMQQRARELGGSLHVEPRDGGGTTVTCTIPPE